MTFDEIIAIYPELDSTYFGTFGVIALQDDGDGIAYIARWDYSKPIPSGMKLGK
jgi:hypothetical protein